MGKSDYYPKKELNRIPHDEWMETIWFIRGYPRRKEEADNYLENSPPPADGQPKGNNVGDSTHATALKREKLLDQNRIIDDAIKLIPPQYREGVLNNVIYKKPYPKVNGMEMYAVGTWSRHRGDFIRLVNKMRWNK